MTKTTKVKRVSDSLPCALTDHELLQFGEQLANAAQSVASAESAKKSAMKQHNYEIQIAQTRRDLFANIVASKQEYREVDVEERWDWDKGVYTRTRTDTGEVTLERPLTDSERQMEFTEITEDEE